MRLFCPNCKIETEQRYIGVDIFTQRVVNRCLECHQTNFTYEENRKSDNVRRHSQDKSVEAVEGQIYNNAMASEEEDYWIRINREWKSENVH
jgi:hypothetical protein